MSKEDDEHARLEAAARAKGHHTGVMVAKGELIYSCREAVRGDTRIQVMMTSQTGRKLVVCMECAQRIARGDRDIALTESYSVEDIRGILFTGEPN